MNTNRLSLGLHLPTGGLPGEEGCPSDPSLRDRGAVRFLTIDEAAAALGVSRRTIQRKVKARLIRPAPLGAGTVRIPWSEILRLEAGLPIDAGGPAAVITGGGGAADGAENISAYQQHT